MESEFGPVARSPQPQLFQAMNTQIQVLGATRNWEPWFHRYEAMLTRFDPASPLSQLNRMSGRWVVVPPLLYRAIRKALWAADLTGGLFDPTILPALVAAGYGRSFEQGPTEARPTSPAGRWREVRLGPGAVWLPPGVALDLGGIGKGLAADLALRRLLREQRRRPGGPHSCLVNAGGDIALWSAPGEEPWTITVDDPFGSPSPVAAFSLYAGAVATSSRLGRRWAGGHHLIDPRTGRPCESSLVSATVFAPSAALADVLAKVCILLGQGHAPALLASQGAHGLLITEAGEQILTPGLEGVRHVISE